jgi:4-hydroxybenzoate polyprenyltransferase
MIFINKESDKILKNFIGIILWNNHFYGIGIVGLSICSSLYLTGQLPSLTFLVMAYFGTVVYYTNAYFNEKINEQNKDRVIWYQKNDAYLKTRQWLLGIVIIAVLIISLYQNPNLLSFDIISICLLGFSLLLSYLYGFPKFQNNGLIKSSIIAFVWTITGAYLPVYFNQSGEYETMNIIVTTFYCIQLFLFIFLLAVLFDIKDIKTDLSRNKKTLVLQIGLNNIIPFLVLPYIIISMIIDYKLANSFSFTLFIWLLYCIFYLIVYLVSKKALTESKISSSILLVDGLILIKASIGIISWYIIN